MNAPHTEAGARVSLFDVIGLALASFLCGAEFVAAWMLTQAGRPVPLLILAGAVVLAAMTAVGCYSVWAKANRRRGEG